MTGGFKFYVSERGFIRTDVLTTLSSDGAESGVWRIGVGVDLLVGGINWKSTAHDEP